MALLAEKWRPKTFKEIIGLSEEIEKYAKEEVIPPMLFSGPAGTGKTTTALVLAKTIGANLMKLNASDETGIDAIRGKISKFAMGKSIDKRRIILLDEADGLSPPAQQNLRGTIDKYQNNCTFILTCNFEGKIIDPLKSRVNHIKFESPPVGNVVGRLKYIAEAEKFTYEEKAIDKIVALTYPDIRNAIKQLEIIALRSNNKITLKDVNAQSLSLPKLIELLKQKKLTEAGALIDKQYIDVERLIEDLSNEFFYGDYSNKIKKTVHLEILRRAYVEINRVKNYKPILRPMLYELMKVLTEGENE